MPTVEEVRAWRVETLGLLAPVVDGQADRVEGRVNAVQAGIVSLGMWWGGAAVSALVLLEQRRKALLRVATALSDLAAALRDGAVSLDSARTSALNAVTAAEAVSLDVSPQWEVTDALVPVGPVVPRQVDARADLLELHADTVREAYRQLDEVDREVWSAITAAWDELGADVADLASGVTYTPPVDLTSMTQSEREEILEDPAFWEWAANHRHDAKALLDTAFDAGGIVDQSDIDSYSAFLKEYWASESMETAGIDGESWDPGLGAEANSETIEKVYTYYGNLFLDRPELQWAGMANMVGPTFGAAFFDLDQLREIGAVIAAIAIAGVGVTAIGKTLADLSDDELAYYETMFLTMQKKIFTDMGGQHEAYLNGGIEEIERLKKLDLLRPKDLAAWKSIDEGIAENDPVKLAEGNLGLADREQNVVIDKEYDEMRNRPVTGEAMMWAATLIGEPSIPGAKNYSDYNPSIYALPGDSNVVSPFPAGDVSVEKDRWDMIENDSWPAYQKLLQEDPEYVRERAAADVGPLMDQERLVRRLPGITRDLVFDWQYVS